MPTAKAIENGSDATDSSFVVPVHQLFSATKFSFCSGGLIEPRIVVTAGHCILNEAGIVSKDIRVGPPGSDQTLSTSSWIKVVSVQITASLSRSTKVQDNDIVFLILESPLVVKIPIRLASEAEVQTLKLATATLRIYGYGATDNLGTKPKFPRFVEQQFDNLQPVPYADSGYIRSKTSGACKGDSGGPVIKITATDVIFIGVITGSNTKTGEYCSFILAPYESRYAVFTLISRYSNLAFAAASYVIDSQTNEASKTEKQFQVTLDKAENDANAALEKVVIANNEQFAKFNREIEDLLKQIATLKVQIPTTIVCAKDKLTKKITAVNPKCPASYKRK